MVLRRMTVAGGRMVLRWADLARRKLVNATAGSGAQIRLPRNLPGLLLEGGDGPRREGAIRRLIDNVAVDAISFELYTTLGAGFRRSGEYANAIAVHEHLVSSESLGAALRHQATLELATDYSVAGLLDRADALLGSVLQANPGDADVRYRALRLCEKQQDWKEALKLAQGGPLHSELPVQDLLAQYCCEIAAEERLAGNADLAEQWLQKALIKEPQCGRALIGLCELCIERRDCESARAHFDRIERHHPALAPEVAEPLFWLLRESGDSATLRRHLQTIRNRRNSYTVIKLARDAIQELEGEKAATRFFIEQVALRPSLKGLHDWAERELQVTRSREKDKIAAIVRMLRGVVDEKPVYQCNQCGYRCNQLQWRCPGCETWKSVNVIVGAEGE